MPRARILAVAVILVSYGAVGARQPAVRSAAPLPAPAATIAEALELSTTDGVRVVLDSIRLAYEALDTEAAVPAQRGALLRVSASTTPGETVPVPLDRSIWRDTLLRRDVPDAQLVGAILADRRTALLYYGLAALDDETLAWLGPDRDLLSTLLNRPGAFAAFSRGFRVKAGRIVVPGGADADPLWEAVVGASPAKPAAFARRLFSQWNGRLAFFYDTIAYLDGPAQRFALGSSLPPRARLERFRALANHFDQATVDMRPETRPFSRQLFDPAVTLSLLRFDADGALAGPAERWVWEAVFRTDTDLEPRFEPASRESSGPDRDMAPVDAAWLISRINRGGYGSGRRRLETVLFAQRLFRTTPPDPDQMITTLRGVAAFPALMLSLERSGIVDAPVLAAAAVRAEDLSRISDDEARRVAMLQFQGALSIAMLAIRSGGVSLAEGRGLVFSLINLEIGNRGFEGRLAKWIQTDLLPCVGFRQNDDERAAERAVLAAMAGVRAGGAARPVIEWEGDPYVVDPARTELRRLTAARGRLESASLDEALAAWSTAPKERAARQAAEALAATLASLVYAAHLGDPDGPSLSAGNVALRHQILESLGTRHAYASWQLPVDEFGAPGGWRLRGSLLGLEVPLSRLALRRLDTGTMPKGPRLTATERQTAGLTVTLMNPLVLTDAGRDEIAAAIGRGRARVAAMTADDVERIAADAGLSGWRREAIGWTVAHHRDHLESQFSLLELFWLGAPRATEATAFDAWGSAALSSTGCLCLEMPRPLSAEHYTGRSVAGILVARGAEVALRVAERLAALKLPAALAPGVMSFAMQEVLDNARLAHTDDWLEFSRAVRGLDNDLIDDYISALAAVGPLMPATSNGGERH